MDLDDILSRSAAPVVVRDDGFSHAIAQAVAQTELAVSRARRRRTRMLVVGGVLAPVMLGGGVAAASGMLPGVVPFSTRAGSECRLDVAVKPRSDGVGAPTTDTARVAQVAAVAAARHYLATLDVNAIDRDDAADRWFDHLERVSVDHPSRSELAKKFSGERLETHSVLYIVDDDLRRHLAGLGYDPRSVVASIASECDQ